MSVRFKAILARNAIANVNDGAPFGEARSHATVFCKALAQAVQAFGDLLPGRAGKLLGAGVHLDPGKDPLAFERYRKRRAIGSRLPYCFVEENHAADELRCSGNSDEEFAVGAAVLHRGFDAYSVEALFAGGGALVYGKYAFAFCHHRGGRGFKFTFVHICYPSYKS